MAVQTLHWESHSVLHSNQVKHIFNLYWRYGMIILVNIIIMFSSFLSYVLSYVVSNLYGLSYVVSLQYVSSLLYEYNEESVCPNFLPIKIISIRCEFTFLLIMAEVSKQLLRN
jgi:hypothetical protein